jgi:hypothetical protein
VDEDLLGDFGLGMGGGSFDEFGGLEYRAGADERDQVWRVDSARAVLGGFDEFERHGESSSSGTGTAGDLGPVPHGGARSGVPAPRPGDGPDCLAGDPPGVEVATISAWTDSTIGVDLDVAGASTDELYAAMDWLLGRQDAIEANLALRHLSVAANPSEMALFDLSSSWMEGTAHSPRSGTPATGRKAKPKSSTGC